MAPIAENPYVACFDRKFSDLTLSKYETNDKRQEISKYENEQTELIRSTYLRRTNAHGSEVGELTADISDIRETRHEL